MQCTDWGVSYEDCGQDGKKCWIQLNPFPHAECVNKYAAGYCGPNYCVDNLLVSCHGNIPGKKTMTLTDCEKEGKTCKSNYIDLTKPAACE